jgi:hypothetical protein
MEQEPQEELNKKVSKTKKTSNNNNNKSRLTFVLIIPRHRDTGYHNSIPSNGTA